MTETKKPNIKLQQQTLIKLKIDSVNSKTSPLKLPTQKSKKKKKKRERERKMRMNEESRKDTRDNIQRTNTCLMGIRERKARDGDQKFT